MPWESAWQVWAGRSAMPLRGAQPLMGDTILTLCFVVVVIGGMGSFTGAILGGLLVGIVESMMALVWPPGNDDLHLRRHGSGDPGPADRPPGI